MKTSIAFVIAATVALVLSACSPTFSTRPISSDEDKAATGLRYLKSSRTEVRVYKVAVDPYPPADHSILNRIERVGDAVVDSLPNPSQLWVVDYRGARFGNKTLTLSNASNGGISALGVTSNSGDTPGALASLQTLQTVAQTKRDYTKTKEQAEIDELSRRKNLIQAMKDLQDAMKSP